MSRRVVSVAAAFVAGLLLWLGFTPAYNSALAPIAQQTLRFFERPPVTRLTAQGNQIVVDRDDFPPRSPRPALPAAHISDNIVLLFALFALSRAPLSTRNVTRLLLAAALLVPLHLAALVAQIESIYALRLGQWSAAHYSRFAREAWPLAVHFYALVGAYAAPFVLWWWLGREALPQKNNPALQRGRGKSTGRGGARTLRGVTSDR